MKYFTHYWANKTWEHDKDYYPQGGLLNYTGGNRLKKCRVEIGDAVYIVSVIQGELFVCAKVIVGKICSISEAAEILNDNNLWENATNHILTSESTPINWNNQVQLSITKQLMFLSGDKSRGLTFKTNNKLDSQTLRGVRQLDSKSAAMLDTLLGDLQPIDSQSGEQKVISLWNQETADGNELESQMEGNKKQRFTTYYERLPENRKQAIKIHGITCKACNFNFEKKYGSYGKGFIQVHHIKPVSEFEKPKKINPKTDLTVLCSNCHSMAHHLKNKTLSVEELKQIINGLNHRKLKK